MSEEQQTAKVQQIRDEPEEPFILQEAERILQSSDPRATSEVVDVALIFYAAVGTVTGSLCGACLYPLLHPFKGVGLGLWIFFLLCAVALCSALGFGITWWSARSFVPLDELV